MFEQKQKLKTIITASLLFVFTLSSAAQNVSLPTDSLISAGRNERIEQSLKESFNSTEDKNTVAVREAKYLEEIMVKNDKVHKLEVRQVMLWFLVGVVFLLIVSTFAVNRFRMQKLMAQNRLKEKEAEEQTRELIHKNNIAVSELKAIRSQMNPHFIFNVLNSLESYILDNDKKTACRLVQKFAGLSRLILENSTQSLVMAFNEWKAVRLYTELQALRYNSMFTFQFDIDDESSLQGYYLPPMLVQPLIENAIIHGVLRSTSAEPHIKVSMCRKDNMVEIKVADNGPGIGTLENSENKHIFKKKSLGVQFVKDRIIMLHEDLEYASASFSLDNDLIAGGAVATLRLPIWSGEQMLATV